MAKYTITYKCGHSEEIQLFGKYSDRESRIKWLETQECSKCLMARLNKERANRLANIQDDGLPKLEGSEKQIAWARAIRQDALALESVQIAINKMKSLKPEQIKWLQDNLDKSPEITTTYAVASTCVVSAKWWIENRNMF